MKTRKKKTGTPQVFENADVIENNSDVENKGNTDQVVAETHPRRAVEVAEARRFPPGALILPTDDIQPYRPEARDKRRSSSGTHYSRDVADQIIGRMMQGESITAICDDPTMPTRAATWYWEAMDIDGFSKRITRARELQADRIVATAIARALDDSGDIDATGRDHPVRVNRARLIMDTLSKVAGWMSPRYRDTGKLEVTGPNGGRIPITLELVAAPTPTPEAMPDPSELRALPPGPDGE